MYTVKELIETLQKCPQDYEVWVNDSDGYPTFSRTLIEMAGIDHDKKVVDLFME